MELLFVRHLEDGPIQPREGYGKLFSARRPSRPEPTRELPEPFLWRLTLASVGVGERLRSRPLDPANDPALLSTVEIGSKPWEREVEIFLRTKAVVHEEKGNCGTTLFLLQDEERVVGFISTSQIKLDIDPEFKQTFEITNKKAPMDPVDAVYFVAIGVDSRFRGQGLYYGSEIHAAFIGSLVRGMVRPRFVFLKVWEDSPAVTLYERWGYRRLGVESENRFGEQIGRVKMALDRFHRPKDA
jgi:ribosomal protein S18 acetylase RimI-like enzyme